MMRVALLLAAVACAANALPLVTVENDDAITSHFGTLPARALHPRARGVCAARTVSSCYTGISPAGAASAAPPGAAPSHLLQTAAVGLPPPPRGADFLRLPSPLPPCATKSSEIQSSASTTLLSRGPPPRTIDSAA